jgi:ribosome maturation factor RimP
MAEVEQKIRDIAERVARDLGLEVADVEFRGGAGKQRMVRIYIDRPHEAGGRLQDANARPAVLGVTHEDCANVSREVSTILDVEDVVPGGAYTLEVSSPGLDRRLSKASDFERFVGSRVKVMTREPIENNRHWEGTLEAFAGGRLTLDLTPKKQKKGVPKTAPHKIEVELGNVERANLVPEI